MLLLYRFGTYLYSAPYSIYIPLCFYFIRDFQSRFPCDLIYLHSTMLLLYLLRFRLSTACSSNLHSTMLLLYRSRCSLCVDRKDIYIPLCFYFILIKFLRKLACVEFTFHYASTLSYSLRLWLLSVQTFTFHYASTLSLITLTVKSLKSYLHSTMLLLYRRSGMRQQSRRNIYIPLCFYFICGVSWYSWQLTSFTFHYASTLSKEWSVT